MFKLEGYDTFSYEEYPLPGEFLDYNAALTAARVRLAELEESQPTASSGGQGGIQDQVYIVYPDGKKELVRN